MAKEGGLGDNFYIGGYDLSTDVAALDTIAWRCNPLVVTAIDKSATERIPGLKDGEMSFSTWFDNATDLAGDALETLPTTDRTAMWFHGVTVGSPTAALIGKQINYDWSRGQDGSLAGTVQVLANGSAVDWGDMLTTGKQTFGGAANGTSIDYTAVSTAFGAVAYLQVFAFTGTSVTVAVQDSADNAAFAAITGLTFTAATGRTEQRLATALTATIRRYVRVSTTGTFSNAVIAVSFTKFLASQA